MGYRMAVGSAFWRTRSFSSRQSGSIGGRGGRYAGRSWFRGLSERAGNVEGASLGKEAGGAFALTKVIFFCTGLHTVRRKVAKCPR